MRFGERLNIIRKEKEMTVAALASLCGTSEGVIRNYIKGRRIPDIEMFVRLCKALEVTPNCLLQDDFDNEKNDLAETIANLTSKQEELAKELVALLLRYHIC